MEPGLIVLIILVIGGIVAYQLYAAAERRKKLSAYARQKGLTFSPEKVRSFHKQHREFKCLHRGHSRYAHNLMTGQMQDLAITAFDYHYATGHGKNRRTHRFSAVIARSPVPLQPLFIRSERFFDRVTEFFGMDDIDFESAEFSREFFVKSPDKRWAYDVIHQRMMGYLLAAPRYSLQFDTQEVIAWRSRRFDGGDFDEACKLIKGVLDRLPDYLFRP